MTRRVNGALVMERLRLWARRLKTEIHGLYIAMRDPRTPWYAKVVAAMVVAYALSPIDLIPDFIPVVGYLDDLLLLPMGVALAIKLIPEEVLVESRARAEGALESAAGMGRVAAFVVAMAWLALLWLAIDWALKIAE